jgi:tRNA wybutosine-synthesizing protein 1
MSLEQLHNAQFMKPEEMVEALVEKRRQLLSGFKGNERVNERLFREAYELFPSHWAISLSGEPTLYPHLPELIAYLKAHKEVKSIFLVTNGQHPEMLQTLMEQDALPTQLYLSTVAYSRTLHQALTRPRYEDGWQRFLNSVELLNTLGNKTRTVMRLTLMKGVNDDVQAFVPLIKTAQPWFVEVKSFIAIGRARQRLGVDKMLSFDEIKERAQKLSLLTSFRYEDDHPPSLIALLSRVSAQQRYIIT